MNGNEKHRTHNKDSVFLISEIYIFSEFVELS